MHDHLKIIALSTALLAAPLAARADDLTLKETGSTLILPVFQAWAQDYAKTHPGVTITTEGSGSAKGIAAAIDGSAQIGTSDAFMSSEQASAHPGILNIAMAISAQTINYNLPGVTQALKLDGPALAGIYLGKIRSWNDPALAKLNPGVTLPDHAIVPVHRAEGSGDTFVFTQYLSFTTEGDLPDGFFTQSDNWSRSPGFGTTIDWPVVEGAQTATTNQGVVDLLAKVPYSIGYVGVSLEDKISAAKLGTAMMRSHSGQFLLPTEESETAAAASLTPRTPSNERLSLINAPGENCYPLINYEYAIIQARQKDPATADALRRFLSWASVPDDNNQKILAANHFIPLPAHTFAVTSDQIQQIK
jgi:phosphate transport system substrate-binding protein